MSQQKSGAAPFRFVYRDDLHNLPGPALECEVDLQGGFAVDKRQGYGHVYYGMPGCGLLRVNPDLTQQELLPLPAELQPMNFHSTKIGQFDGRQRLFLPANNDGLVAVIRLDGELEFLLPRPEFDAYQAAGVAFKPTDTALDGARLFVADGYGSNYITTADVNARRWSGIFGGKTDDAQEHGKFGTAHGVNLEPHAGLLAIADRAHSRIEIYDADGGFVRSHTLPAGSRPCGVDYAQIDGRWVAVVGSLVDPQEGRPAPIYIVDASTYEVLSTMRPKEALGVALADHIHNVVWHQYNGQLYLVCQSWNPGYFFVLEQA